MSMGIEQDEMREILEEFFTEADENLDAFEQDLIQLEALAEDGDSVDKETVDRLFRGLHTLKGGAGFLGLAKMASLAHAGENLLDEVRNGVVPATKPVMDALLQSSDALKELLATYKAGESDEDADHEVLVAELNRLIETKGAAGDGVAEAAAPAADDMVNKELLAEVIGDDVLDPSRDKGEDDAPAAKPVAAPAADDMVNKELLAEVIDDDVLDPSRDKGEDDAPAAKPAVAPAAADMVNKELLAEVMGDDVLDPSRDSGDDDAPAAKAAPAPEPVAAPKVAATPVEESKAKAPAPKRGDEGSNETIRVETSRLDKVMNLVGELVLARNSLLRQLHDREVMTALEAMPNHALIYGNLEQLSRVTQDLQMSVLSTRMQPIKKVFDKIPRQVRELKTKLRKEVNLIIEGEGTEVDKSLVEELADPMVHMVRNALDHGIETPDEREMSGKSREGTLVVRAFYEGNNVVIQVQEDGKGIDPAKIRKVAVKKGIITESAAAALSDAEAVRLIMAPGFSTAEAITDVSGRGVGMDVVNNKIANLQGSLDISSEFGKGTCFSIYLPLTLAIVNALIVGANREGFAIPIGDISEVIRFQPEHIHRVSNSEVIELRGESLPLFYLSKLTKPKGLLNADGGVVQAKELTLDDLEMAVPVPQEPAKEVKGSHGFVVVVRDGSQAMGLVVQELLGQEEVVVKPVTDVFAYNSAISGATITGDGKVHMILDVPYLLKDMSK
ncbi:MAG: chemotaxis protein CheA [Pseudomonadaceae bacterium]|nr:chemotaxis protein CheA [Pseudomonadaceae bacterium]